MSARLDSLHKIFAQILDSDRRPRSVGMRNVSTRESSAVAFESGLLDLANMPRPRFERLEESKRDVILDAAEGEFAAHGFARASYNRVIERAGVSKGAMYYYFDDKADLYLTVVRRAFADLFALVVVPDTLSTPDAFWEACGTMMERVTAHLNADQQRAEALRGLLRSLNEAPPSVRELLADARNPTKRVLEVGRRAGAVREDLPIDMLAAMVLGLGDTIDTWIATNWKSLRPAEFGEPRTRFLEVARALCNPPKQETRGVPVSFSHPATAPLEASRRVSVGYGAETST